MPTHFVKIYGTIRRSSIWAEDPATRLTWLTLLIGCDQDGFYEGSVPGLALEANLPLDAVKEAVGRLEAPDPQSQDPADEGRRIRRVDRGWMVLNYLKWREYRTDSQVAAAARSKRYRDASRSERDASRSGRDVVTPKRDASRASREVSTSTSKSVGSSPSDGSRNTMEVVRFSVPSETDARHGQEHYTNELGAVKGVFDYWRVKTGHERAQWNDQRRRFLLVRLREEPGTLDQKAFGLKQAVDGALLDPLFNGAEKGKAYLEFENIFVHQGRNRIEKLQNVARGGDSPVAGAVRSDDLESQNKRAIAAAIKGHKARAITEGS